MAVHLLFMQLAGTLSTQIGIAHSAGPVPSHLRSMAFHAQLKVLEHSSSLRMSAQAAPLLQFASPFEKSSRALGFAAPWQFPKNEPLGYRHCALGSISLVVLLYTIAFTQQGTNRFCAQPEKRSAATASATSNENCLPIIQASQPFSSARPNPRPAQASWRARTSA
ncbi:Uncharacterised protein [Candidatus Burarchaeum australiense]|nr:Uncharacterised protein [Candidatus Burarchaeum australiense]